jgi:ankyrin repeat protein
MCDSGTLFGFLLGSFKTEEGVVKDNRKPRVDINYKDLNGMTALHYALVPTLDSNKGRR